VLSGEVRGHTGATPYLRWGDAPALIAIGLGLFGALAASGRANRSR
jgi:apolipoprotein N-acyltransferase